MPQGCSADTAQSTAPGQAVSLSAQVRARPPTGESQAPTGETQAPTGQAVGPLWAEDSCLGRWGKVIGVGTEASMGVTGQPVH